MEAAEVHSLPMLGLGAREEQRLFALPGTAAGHQTGVAPRRLGFSEVGAVVEGRARLRMRLVAAWAERDPDCARTCRRLR